MSPDLALWLLPVAGPMIAAPLIILWTGGAGDARFWTIPEEVGPAGVLALHAEVLARWQGPAASGPPDGVWNPAPALA